MSEEELKEKMAELEHKQWMRWAETLILRENLSPNRVERWNKLFVPYHELSEEMKDEDRKEADIVLTLIRDAGWKPKNETTLELLDELMGRIKKNLEGGEDDAEKIQRNCP